MTLSNFSNSWPENLPVIGTQTSIDKYSCAFRKIKLARVNVFQFLLFSQNLLTEFTFWRFHNRFFVIIKPMSSFNIIWINGNTNSIKNWGDLTFQILFLTEEGIPTTSRYSDLEYCAFAQHCLSTLFIWSVNKLLTVLETDISDSNFL